MTLPTSFAEFKKNPIAAVTFCMLIVVGYLYYDSENTKQGILKKCKSDNEKMSERIATMERQQNQNNSLLAVYSYEIKFYLSLIKGYLQNKQK